MGDSICIQYIGPHKKKNTHPKKNHVLCWKRKDTFHPIIYGTSNRTVSLFRFVNFLQRVVVNQEQLKKQRVETTNATGDGRVCDLANSTDGAMVLGEFCGC